MSSLSCISAMFGLSIRSTWHKVEHFPGSQAPGAARTAGVSPGLVAVHLAGGWQVAAADPFQAGRVAGSLRSSKGAGAYAVRDQGAIAVPAPASRDRMLPGSF